MRRLLLLPLWLPAAALAAGLTSTDINTPAPGTTRELLPYRAYDLSGFGTQFGTHEAECKGHFVWREVTGDFDVWCRVAMVSNRVGHCTAAGIMARASTDPRAPFVRVVAHSFNRVWKGYDPYAMGARFQEGGRLVNDASWVGGYLYCIPKNRVNADIPFPNCWVRLQRRGNEFTAYFAETVGVPTEADWQKHPPTFVLGNGPPGPTVRDTWGVYPKTMLVGLCLEANVEGEPGREAFASFHEVHGLEPRPAAAAESSGPQ